MVLISGNTLLCLMVIILSILKRMVKIFITGKWVDLHRQQNIFLKKLKLNAVLRAEKNKYFDAKFSPRIAAVYSPVERHNFRAAFQVGYRFPSLFEAFSHINSGG